MPGITQMLFSEKELIGLYILLKGGEDTLDFTMSKLLSRVESYLYQKLTIEELENIDFVYRNHFDTDEKKS